MPLNKQAITLTNRRAHSLSEISAQLGVCRGFLNNEIDRGKLKARKLGRRIVVLNTDLEAYLAGSESSRGTAAAEEAKN
jgi:excisionase family DNA binding protein